MEINDEERRVNVEEELDSFDSGVEDDGDLGSEDAELVGRINKRRRLGAGEP